QSNGAAASNSMLSGIRTTKSSVTTMCVAYPPWVGSPYLSTPAYVGTLPFRQYCSSPFWQFLHSPHESTMQPTPTRSPTLYLETFDPTSVTIPAISCPGTSG